LNILFIFINHWNTWELSDFNVYIFCLYLLMIGIVWSLWHFNVCYLLYMYYDLECMVLIWF